MSADHFYRHLDPSLPDIGWARMMPQRPSAEAARAIHACENAEALGAMLGAARAYWGSAGAIALSAFGGAAAAVLGWSVAAAAIFAFGALGANGAIEARRRGRQWAAIIEARLAVLGKSA